MAPSNELNHILEEITENYGPDIPALVMALREARRRFLIHLGPEAQCEVQDYDKALTAILNQGRAKQEKELGEKDAS